MLLLWWYKISLIRKKKKCDFLHIVYCFASTLLLPFLSNNNTFVSRRLAADIIDCATNSLLWIECDLWIYHFYAYFGSKTQFDILNWKSLAHIPWNNKSTNDGPQIFCCFLFLFFLAFVLNTIFYCISFGLCDLLYNFKSLKLFRCITHTDERWWF